MNEESYDVEFRHLSFEAKAGIVEGIGLWYPTKEEAIRSFSFFHKYITAPGWVPKSLDITFNRDKTAKDKYSLYIEINVEDEVYKTNISGIEKKYIDSILLSLRRFPYYFITAGSIDEFGKPQTLPLKEYHFFRNRIDVDGETIEGVPNPGWPARIFNNDE